MIKRWLKDYIEINKRDIFLIVSFIIVGIIIGICIYLFTSQNVKNISENFVREVFELSKNEGYIKTNIILNGIKINAVLLIILCMLSVTLFGKWIIYLIISFKGVALAIYTILLFKIFGPFWGLAAFFLLVVLVNIIYIPALIYITVTFLEINFNIFKARIKSTNISLLYKGIFSFAVAFILMFSSIIVEQISSNIVLSIYSKM